MTDKQIIDGVDVSGCKHAMPTTTTPKCGIKDWIHCDGLNCYYKEYKRKEQECEELKETLKNSRCAWKSLEGTFCPEAQEQLDQLKFDYAELEKRHNDSFEQFKQLKAENDGLKSAYARLNSLYNDNCNFTCKLGQTLTEIKEIVTCPKKIETTFNINNWIEVRNNILQKISEVLK